MTVTDERRRARPGRGPPRGRCPIFVVPHPFLPVRQPWVSRPGRHHLFLGFGGFQFSHQLLGQFRLPAGKILVSRSTLDFWTGTWRGWTLDFPPCLPAPPGRPAHTRVTLYSYQNLMVTTRSSGTKPRASKARTTQSPKSSHKAKATPAKLQKERKSALQLPNWVWWWVLIASGLVAIDSS